jgi:hypothetical protein
MTRALVLLVTFCLAAGAAAQERWATYANPRFGTTVDYPADLFSQLEPPPENGDGQGFRSRDGRARLLVWGHFNAGDDTPESYVQQYIEPHGGVTYRQITRRYFAVSGLRNGDIFYQRCNFSAARDGVVDCFEATYPAADKAPMDRVIARLSRSLHNAPGRHQ